MSKGVIFISMVHSRLGSGLRKVERAGLLLGLKKCNFLLDFFEMYGFVIFL
jgi:hypothetical protein